MVEAIWTVRNMNGLTEVHLIDQRLLPSREIVVECRSHKEIADAIREMVVRGAPAIGISAAFGVALGAQELAGLSDPEAFTKKMEAVERTLAATRPTAVNLFWALSRMRPLWERIATQAPEERTAILFAIFPSFSAKGSGFRPSCWTENSSRTGSPETARAHGAR